MEAKDAQAKNWREMIKIDNDGREYLPLEGAALFLECSAKTLSNHLYDESRAHPRPYKKNGRLRFYLDDLRAFDEGRLEVKRDTNWLTMRRSA